MPRSSVSVARRLVVAGLLATIVAPPAAEAEPFVGKIRTATATIRVKGTDGQFYAIGVTLDIVAPTNGTTTNHVSVSIASCAAGSCGAATRYAVTPESVNISDDLASASVTGRFAGLPLDVSWAGSPPSSPPTYVRVGVAPSDYSVYEWGGGEAGVVAKVLGVKCVGAGDIEGRYQISADYTAPDTGRTPPKSPPRAFRNVGRKSPRCHTT